jgi:hypothetical protein
LLRSTVAGALLAPDASIPLERAKALKIFCEDPNLPLLLIIPTGSSTKTQRQPNHLSSFLLLHNTRSPQSRRTSHRVELNICRHHPATQKTYPAELTLEAISSRPTTNLDWTFCGSRPCITTKHTSSNSQISLFNKKFTKMDAGALRECTASTLSANADIRRQAELQLKSVSPVEQNFNRGRNNRTESARTDRADFAFCRRKCKMALSPPSQILSHLTPM